jgi:hypothetical protein
MLKRDRQPAERAVMGGTEILVFFCLGCAALALWVLARFPALGPRRPTAVVLAVVGIAIALKIVGPPLLSVATGLGRIGPLVALLAVVLPLLTVAFWVSGCALRALAETPGFRR